MNIKQLKTLLAVVEFKSFAAAGDKLGLSHSAISLQFKAMEDELGVQLFDRIKRPPVPTARARALAEHAAKTLALFEESTSVARGERVRNNLRIGAVPTALASFLPAALRQLHKQFPALRIEMRNAGSSVLADLAMAGKLDVAVCTSPVNPLPGLYWHAIATEPFVVIAPVQSKGTDWRELLQNHPFIWFNRKTWAGQSISEALQEMNVTVNATMEIDSLEAITALVREGLGVSIVPICKGKRPFSEDIRSLPFGTPLSRARLARSPGPAGGPIW